MSENAEQTTESEPGLDFILRRARSALVRYEAEYDRLTDVSGSVQALNRLMGKITNKDGIVAKILREQIREARKEHQPDLPTPLSLADSFVRAAVQTLGATDFEKELGKRISDLELKLRYAQKPKSLREHMLCLLDGEIDKDKIWNVIRTFFDGVREGKCVCCVKEPNTVMIDTPTEVTSFASVEGCEGMPYLAVQTSPDSLLLPDLAMPSVVFPMAKVLEGLRQYDVLAGLAFDPWDRGGLLLKRDFILETWERYEVQNAKPVEK